MTFGRFGTVSQPLLGALHKAELGGAAPTRLNCTTPEVSPVGNPSDNPSSDLFIDVRVTPADYRHWKVDVDGSVATVTMQVDPAGGLRDDYELKTNSYDLGVDIELYDVVQRLRFEHPEVKAVVVTGGLDKIFCAGANIQMLAGSTHAHKVNFCKFTNETRNSIEDATDHSGQTWIAAVNGTAAGGGYELALACEEILLVDDRASAVSLPEVPLLAVLPGTGGLTRVVDKRHVRRDLADAFATRTEGIKGKQAVEWKLVDHVAAASQFDQLVADRAADHAARSDRPDDAAGIELTPIERSFDGDTITYEHVTVTIDRDLAAATISIAAPTGPQPATGDELAAAGASAWVIAAAREFDDAMLHLRFNESTVGTWLLETSGGSDAVVAAERVLADDHWLARETRLYWTRVLKRLDLSARSLFALIQPGSCFAGLLAEVALAADRSYMLDGTWEDSDVPAATFQLTEANSGWFPMSNGLSRLASRFWGADDELAAAESLFGKALLGAEAADAGLVTASMDDIDWEDEIRVMIEERASFSPDALTGMEANHRFVGPETMETKIFSRLTAWQNWIFQRPNAVGPDGALRRFGTGSRPDYDRNRV
jgi:benzoyl-CoA-dihydrodiol lyase